MQHLTNHCCSEKQHTCNAEVCLTGQWQPAQARPHLSPGRVHGSSHMQQLAQQPSTQNCKWGSERSIPPRSAPPPLQDPLLVLVHTVQTIDLQRPPSHLVSVKVSCPGRHHLRRRMPLLAVPRRGHGVEGDAPIVPVVQHQAGSRHHVRRAPSLQLAAGRGHPLQELVRPSKGWDVVHSHQLLGWAPLHNLSHRCGGVLQLVDLQQQGIQQSEVGKLVTPGPCGSKLVWSVFATPAGPPAARGREKLTAKRPHVRLGTLCSVH